MPYGAVYRITCLVNGKKYIGQTTKIPPVKRLQEHIKDAYKGADLFLSKAIRKYSKENFSFEILGYAEDQIALDVLETLLISINRSFSPYGCGYNMTTGPSGSPVISPEVRLKISRNTTIAMARPEVREKQLAGLADPVMRAAHRVNTKEALNKPENKERRIVSLKAAWDDPVVRENHRVGNERGQAKRRVTISDPAFIEKFKQAINNAINDPVVLDKKRIAATIAMNDPEIKERHRAACKEERRRNPKRWITDGISETTISPDAPIPDGWRFGRYRGST